MIKFQCPYCQVYIRCPDEASGKSGKCPKCSKVIYAPVINKNINTSSSNRKPSNSDNTITFAGFFRRLCAKIIDGMLISMPSQYFLMYVLIKNKVEIFNEYKIFVFIIQLFLVFIYLSVFYCSKYQATIGKQLLGIIIVNVKGKRISLETAFFRYLLEWVSCILLFLGYLPFFFSKRKQTYYDKAIGTFVIKKFNNTYSLVKNLHDFYISLIVFLISFLFFFPFCYIQFLSQLIFSQPKIIDVLQITLFFSITIFVITISYKVIMGYKRKKA